MVALTSFTYLGPIKIESQNVHLTSSANLAQKLNNQHTQVAQTASKINLKKHMVRLTTFGTHSRRQPCLLDNFTFMSDLILETIKKSL